MPAVGVNISDSTIKYAMLARGRTHAYLESYGEIKLKSGLVEDGVVQDKTGLLPLLEGIAHDTKAKFSVASLPEEKAYIFETIVPKGHDVRESLELHIEEHVPLPASEIVFDYDYISPTNDGKSISVAVSAMSRVVVESLTEVLTDSGLAPVCLEPESHAIARSVVASDLVDPVMVVDIGRASTNIAIIADGVVHASSSVSIGGTAITKAIEEDFTIDHNEADKMKKDSGMKRMIGDKKLFYSIVRVATVIRDEISRRHYYWDNDRDETGNNKLTEVIVCGGNANIPGLAEYLASGVPLPVSKANPWVNIMSVEEHIPKVPACDSLSYVSALGLALRGINPNHG